LVYDATPTKPHSIALSVQQCQTSLETRPHRTGEPKYGGELWWLLMPGPDAEIHSYPMCRAAKDYEGKEGLTNYLRCVKESGCPTKAVLKNGDVTKTDGIHNHLPEQTFLRGQREVGI